MPKVDWEPIKPKKPKSIWIGMDTLHFCWDDVLSYNKTWNFVISSRENGKSVNSWIKLYNAYYYNGCPSIVLRRRIADMTSAYLDDAASVINKFLVPEEQIQLLYLKGDVQSGIADVHVGKAGETYSWQAIKKLPVFFRVIGLSTPMNRIKSMMLSNVRYFFFDEFIANTRGGERYLTAGEKFLIQEIYTTYNREAKRPIKIICAGNPYSVYCPIFADLKVDTTQLKPGAFVVGDDYVINCFETPPELKAKILAANPQYQFDDVYERYAFGGEAVNDSNIRIQKREPRGFKLRYVFKVGHDFISIHYGKPIGEKEPFTYWACKHTGDWLNKVSKRRRIVVFNYADLIEGTVKWTPEDWKGLSGLKSAMAKRKITYNCVDAAYMLEDLEVYF